ncbi:ABC transporter permease [Pseudooceanicola sp. HF7]|nr:ABC transporter permease [Pseudooceanicola sp. HF7]
MSRRMPFDADTRRGLSQISLPFAFSILLLAAPLALLLAMSFWTQDFLTLDRTPTIANFVEVWNSPIYRTLMLRSLKISLIVTFLTVSLAYPAAYYMSFVAPDNRKALLVFLITIPFWTSYLMRIFLWKVILGYNGVLNESLMGIGLIREPLDFILYNQFAVALTLSHAWLPFAVLPIFVVMEKVNRSYLEAAQDLGDTPFQRFRRITLPLSMPGVVAATLIVFIPTIGDYVTPKLVGGSSGLMIANMIEVQFKNANNAPLGATLALMALLLVSSVAGLFVWINRRYLKEEGAA